MIRCCLLIFLIALVSCGAEHSGEHLPPLPDTNLLPLPLEFASDPELYQAALAADTLIYVGQVSQMVVWIGLEMFKPDFGPHSVVQTTDLPVADGFFYASVRPRVGGQGLALVSVETRCIRINPRGSFDRFDVKAVAEGTAFVSADINLHEHENCTDTPWPRITERLRVEVKVMKPGLAETIGSRLAQVWDIIWEQLLLFIGGAAAIIFGWILYKLRKRFPQQKNSD